MATQFVSCPQLELPDRRPSRSSHKNKRCGPPMEKPGVPAQRCSSWMAKYSNLQEAYVRIKLPRYVKPVPSTITGVALQYMRQKSVFEIPAVSHRNELLRCYIQYVHPLAQVVDLQHFLSTMLETNPRERISLLLLQAIMFSGTAFIDMCYLKAQGFETRKAARATYFMRVKLLYEFDYERDRVVIIQALLLMTELGHAGEGLKDSSFWLSEAISVGKALGFNASSPNATMGISRRRLWRRLWWACYTRDRLLAIGTRQPLLMSDDDINIPMLEPSDFETDPLPLEINCMLGSMSIIVSSSMRTLLAAMCVHLTKLSVCIGRILETQYAVPDRSATFLLGSRIRLAPKISAIQDGDFECCESDLDAWSDNLPVFIRPERPAIPISNQLIQIHCALIACLYCTAVVLLHRPQTMPATRERPLVPDLMANSNAKVGRAASQILDVLKDLYALDLIRYLPSAGVCCLSPVLVVNMLDIESMRNSKPRRKSLNNFEFCVRVLAQLRDIHTSAALNADFVQEFLRSKTDQHHGIPHALPSSKSDRTSCNSATSSANDVLRQSAEASKMAQALLFASTITPDERALIAAFAPTIEDNTINGIMTGFVTPSADDREESCALSETMTQEPPVEVCNNGLTLYPNDDERSDDEDIPKWLARESSSCIDLNLIFIEYLTTPANNACGSRRSDGGCLDVDGELELSELPELAKAADLESFLWCN